MKGGKNYYMKTNLFIGLFIIISASYLIAETEEEKKGFEIMMKNYEQMTTKNFRTDVRILLIDTDGRVQTRHVKRISQTDDEDQESYFVRFESPPSVRDTALLIIEHNNAEDDIWFYLPSIGKVKRISGANKRSSYMGTEFSYWDITREKVKRKEIRYVYLGTETLDGVLHYVIDAFPISEREKTEQGYQKRTLWIRSDNYLISKARFYDESGNFLKEFRGYELTKVGNSGKERYARVEMTNNKGVKTVIHFDLMRINEEPVDPKFFSKATLEKKR
jgi:hypothetical protein